MEADCTSYVSRVVSLPPLVNETTHLVSKTSLDLIFFFFIVVVRTYSLSEKLLSKIDYFKSAT